ncbi:MAG: histidine kinase N-terminal 7TM domain-containing protein, partial [Anaerolineales bacterium]|nr:histidine kinase N-terminal 7TM domain-containing protein [Anaerolineales bacterium]
MLPNFDRYVSLAYFLAAIPYAVMGLYAWRKRPAVAVTPFAWLMLSMSIWALMYSMEIALPTIPLKKIALSFEYIGSASIPVFLIFFAFEFTGRSHWLTWRARILLWALPLLTILLIWTSEYHRLIWEIIGVVRIDGLVLLDINYRPIFWIFTIFTAITTLTAVILLLAEIAQRPDEYRAQIALIAFGILAPLAATIFYILKASVASRLDLTPILSLPASLGLSWAITRRYRLQELFPLEYLTVLRNMKDGVIVTDGHQRVVYLNPIAESLLGRSEAEAIGQPLNHVSKLYGEKLVSYLAGGGHRAELTFEEELKTRTFEVSDAPVASLNASKVASGAGRMVVLHDITHLKETETALSRRESIMSAMSLAAEQFLKETAWEHSIPGVLEKIGQSADLSHIFVVMNYADDKQAIRSSLCYEWANANAVAQINNPELRHVSLDGSGMDRWKEVLSQGSFIAGLVKDFPESERKFLKKIGSLSIAVIPIFVNKQWWGFIMFDECRYEREWTNTELEALSIAASMFGSAETRARTEQKLIRRQRSLDLLHEIVLASLKTEDLLAMSQALVEKFAALIHADGCSLILWNEISQQEVQLAAFGSHKQPYQTLPVLPAERTF